MIMAVVKVRVVRMPVPKPFMPVPVRVRFDHRPIVDVLVVIVMDVPMLVLDRVVRMFVNVSLGEMKPEAERHKHAGGDQLSCDGLAQQGDRDNRAEEGSQREIGSSPGAAEVAQRQDKQHKADPDADKTQRAAPPDGADGRQAGAEKQREGQVDASSHDAFDERDDHGSADESLRVRLLSTPHARHAVAMSNPPASKRIPRPRHDRMTAPAGSMLRRAEVSDRRSP